MPKMKVPKKTETESSATAADLALRKLEEYGERFLATFDDDDKLQSSKASTSGRTKAGGARLPLSVEAAPTKSHKKGKAGSGAIYATKASPPHISPKGQQKQQQQQCPEQPTASAPETTTSGALGKRQGGSSSEIDAIMRAGRKATRGQKSTAGQEPGSAAGTPTPAAAAQQAALAEKMRWERKLFMSHKASKVHEVAQLDARAAPGTRSSGGDEADVTPEEWHKLQLEVEKFAAGALDKKAAKVYKARMLARLGAKADTAPRTAASIGKGMALVAAKRQARALEEAIETGMVQRKGLGKKKRAMKAKNRDRGLMEAGPAFKNGVLRVKPMKKIRAESGKLRLPKGVL